MNFLLKVSLLNSGNLPILTTIIVSGCKLQLVVKQEHRKYSFNIKYY